MTQEDKDKITGQVRREYREARQELAMLTTKAEQLGRRLSDAATVLINQPENFIFEQQLHDGRFNPYRGLLFKDGDFAEFTAANVRAITSQIRDLTITADRLRQRVAELEGEDPEKR